MMVKAKLFRVILRFHLFLQGAFHKSHSDFIHLLLCLCTMILHPELQAGYHFECSQPYLISNAILGWLFHT